MNALTFVSDHLWQSTLFVVGVALLTLAFRTTMARVRHGLWLAASLKFFVPMAALVAIGQQLGWATPVRVVRIERAVMINTPAPPPVPLPPPGSGVDVALSLGPDPGPWPEWLPLALGGLWAAGALVVLALWWIKWHRVASIAGRATALVEGREVDILRRLERATGADRKLPIVATGTAIEPGVFGIFRPILLWPETIGARLTDDQIEAILSHELAHVRRRDNLAAAIQSAVQALFWFHPLVWWIGSRLVDERERACDEEVVRLGSRPHVYAESILRTCQYYVEAPLACMAGVTGSDLKRRIEQIMRNHPCEPVGAWRKGLLAAVTVAVVAGPIIFGAFNAPLRAQASTTRDVEGPRQIVFHRPAGPFRVTNFSVRELVRFAYQLQDEQIIGLPEWAGTDRFDIELKWESDPSAGQVQDLVRDLLALQFGLTTHLEQRAFPAYALVRAGQQLGPQLKPSSSNCTTAADTGVAGVEPCDLRRNFDDFPNGIYARGITLNEFVQGLNRDGLVRLDRTVVDRTGLTGRFDVDFSFYRGPHVGRDSLAARVMNTVLDTLGYPTLFDALDRQLGLRLVEQNAPVDVLVVDRVQRPGRN